MLMWVGTGEQEAHTPGIAQDHRTDLEQLQADRLHLSPGRLRALERQPADPFLRRCVFQVPGALADDAATGSALRLALSKSARAGTARTRWRRASASETRPPKQGKAGCQGGGSPGLAGQRALPCRPPGKPEARRVPLTMGRVGATSLRCCGGAPIQAPRRAPRRATEAVHI